MSRARVTVVAIAIVACSAPPRTPPPRATPSRLPVVAIVVDQMGAWIADERWPLLPTDGGFARLMREGTTVKDLRYAHALTDTAPGHSALFTGATPRVSGIDMNEVLDGESGRRVSILRDTGTELVGEGGPIAGSAGSSLARLKVDTLADRLRAADPGALIVSLSLKDRGSLFGGGRAPTVSLWLDTRGARMVTSTAFAQAVPAWASALGSAEALAQWKSEVWRPLDTAWIQAHAATPDAQDGEGDAAGLGLVFPHVLANTSPFGNAFRTTPFADDLLLTLALAALDAEHPEGRSTLLAISLSANDYIGHTFGPDSWEAWDELRRLDASLARFFLALDARFGRDGYAVLLTADHGVTTMPEATLLGATRPYCQQTPYRRDRWRRVCGPVSRILPEKLVVELRAAAGRALGDGDWVRGIADPYVFLTTAARALPPERQRALIDALTATLRAHAEIAEVFEARSLPAVCPDAREGEPIAALVCRSMAGQAGDLYVVPRPGSFFDPNVVVGKGTSHGTPYVYDRAVPLVVRAPGRVPAGVVIEEPVAFGAFARTAASLLGIQPPAAASGARDLSR